MLDGRAHPCFVAMTTLDTLWLSFLFLGLLAFMIVAPFLYIYFRRKTAKPRIKTSPAVPIAQSPPVLNPPGTEISPAKPARPNLPQPKPVPPEQRLRAAYIFTFMISLGYLANAVAPLLTANQIPISYLRVTIYGAAGLLLLLLGFFARRRSQTSLMLAAIIFIFSQVFDFISFPPTSSFLIFCRGGTFLFVLLAMWNGIQAIRELNEVSPPPDAV
jgi:hypothetical protein